MAFMVKGLPSARNGKKSQTVLLKFWLIKTELERQCFKNNMFLVDLVCVQDYSWKRMHQLHTLFGRERVKTGTLLENVIHHHEELKDGRPKSSGLKCSKESRMSWTLLCSRERSARGSGTHTTCIPAAHPASTPLGASSNTRTWGKCNEVLSVLRVPSNSWCLLS